MATKQAQFRFEENLYSEINKPAQEEGMTVSEVVRNAIKLYLAIYERTKLKNNRLFLENDTPQNKEKCELVLPWIR